MLGLWLVVMNAFTPSLAPASTRNANGATPTSVRWAALYEAGNVVAMLAGVSSERPSHEMRNFPVMIRDCDEQRREAAERGLADLSAIMEPGLAALMAINARGNDCRAAAQALWHEFTVAREALLNLLPPTGAMGPRRSA